MSSQTRVATPATFEVALLAGPTDHQVLQRAASGSTDLVLEGTTTAPQLTVAVINGDGAAACPPVTVTPVGGRWQARLGVPTGGPYEVEAGSGADCVTLVSDLLVGDLWVLAGQSNMQGFTHTDGLDPSHPRVHVLDMARRWRLADDRLHRLSESPDTVHCGETEDEKNWFRMFDGDPTFGAGLGTTFGRELAERTGVPVGLIATAHAGTSLAQWNPALRGEGGRSMYGSMMLSVEAAGGRIAGVAWYQGETDAMEGSTTFTADLDGLIRALRADLEAPSLPFLHVQLGRVLGVYPDEMAGHWTRVREEQRVYPGATAFVTAVDLELADPIHLDAASLRRLGRRLARVAGGQARCLDVASVKVEGDGSTVLVEYRGHTGGLRAGGRVRGFSITDAGGAEVPLVFSAEILEDPSGSVRLRLARPVEAGDALWYGRGIDPAGDLVDAEDMAAPAFGPWPLQPAPPLSA